VRIALVVGLLAMVGGILVARGWNPISSGNDSPPSMPVSPAIEAAYGIRFTSVDVTAAGGMIQLRYQVLDSDKTAIVHDQNAAPYVVDSRGVKYADPGMVGHSHIGPTRAAGTSDFVLLANARGGVKPGSAVTIKVGSLELRNVPVL
jgi:hypothetical protein